MHHLLEPILDTIARYPEWAGLAIFLLASIETIVVIGYILPGTWLMLSFGLLVGTGALRFDVAMMALAAGGILGDAVSYWMGRRYGRRIFAFRFFRRHHGLVTKAETFFTRHGGKAVFLARVLGPIRPLVPFFAGLSRMNLVKFTVCNVVSAVVAAFAHLLPGIAIGLGLQFTSAMTWRLVILLLLIAVVVWLCYVFARRALRFANTTGPALAERLTRWARSPARARSFRERSWAAVVLPFVDPNQRATVAMGLLGVVALGCFAGVIVLAADIAGGQAVTPANIAIFNFLDGLRTAWADQVMVAMLGLGETPVLLPVVVAVLAILLLRRDWQISGYWLLTTAFAYSTAAVLETVVEAAPGALQSGASGNAFASANAAVSVIVLGYLALLCLPAISQRRWRLAVLFAASLLVGLISFAQLYLGGLYISGLAGGLLLGLGWLAVLAVVTFRHIPNRYPRWGRTLGVSALAVLIAAGSLNFVLGQEDRLVKYARPLAQKLVLDTVWRDRAWRELPAYRIDFVGKADEPLNVQVAGDLVRLREAITRTGWREAPSWGLVHAVAFLTGLNSTVPGNRPVLPRFWNGNHETFVLIKPFEGGRFVLRLWNAGYRLIPGGKPLLLGTVEREVDRPPLFFDSVHLPPRATGFSDAARLLAGDFGGDAIRRSASGGTGIRIGADPAPWDGTTALIEVIDLEASTAAAAGEPEGYPELAGRVTGPVAK